MTMPPSSEWKDLADSAASLTDEKFLRIVELLEQIRHRPGVPIAISHLRPRMAVLRPPRRMTASRLFFLPVEDLLDDVARYQRRLSRVSRSTLAVCWEIVGKAVPERQMRRIERELATPIGHGAARAQLGGALWQAGSAALHEALAEAGADHKRRVALFGRDDDVLRQVQVVADAAAIGEEIEAIKAKLPDAPIESFADFHVEELRKAIRGMAARDITAVTTFLLVLTARMLRPGDLLAVLADTRLDGMQREKEAVGKEVGGHALENLLRQSGEMPTLLKGDVSARDVALMAERLLDGLDSMRATLQDPDHRKSLGRVERARGIIADAILDRVIGPADQEVLAPICNLPDAALAPLRPGEPPVNAKELAKAEEFARAYRRCARIAPMVGLRNELQAKTSAICLAARTAADNIGEALEAGAAMDPRAADTQVVALLRLVEIISGPDQAEAILLEWEKRARITGPAGGEP
ncbi:hypothetical protein HHL28_06700 [Aerophototrophica crusticola]|uniref:Uncharacterized protein n=1 Tax=Aerophototrophica crusticola TaxID=1709002 RepID=A0A858R5Z8_9PROT|nr:hypothetical protein HHL28_06700 [Rhodospirillaceae bacterium B3]